MIKWYGEKIADAGFVINLQSRYDRLENVWCTLKSSNITGVKRFDAIHKRGGCTLSHIEVAKLQIKNNWDYVLYLEDDIKLDIFYEPQYSDQEKCPSKEIDVKKVVKHIKEDLLKHKPDVLWLGTRPEGPVQQISNMFLRPEKTVMAHAYIGSLKYAKFIVDNLKYEENTHFTCKWPIDLFISELNNKEKPELFEDICTGQAEFLNNDLKVYMTMPNIFIQGPSYSDLDHQFVDHEIWVKGCFEDHINFENLDIKKYLVNNQKK